VKINGQPDQEAQESQKEIYLGIMREWGLLLKKQASTFSVTQDNAVISLIFASVS
jgi:hypothetical protein